jgi:hypothetical protein
MIILDISWSRAPTSAVFLRRQYSPAIEPEKQDLFRLVHLFTNPPLRPDGPAIFYERIDTRDCQVSSPCKTLAVDNFAFNG